MGVAGCGKSTVGAALAKALDTTYLDGDDLHPQSNIDKMAAGTPLEDADRWPWLDDVGAALTSHDGPILIGCSALKNIYRDRIRAAAGEVFFLHLHGPRDVIETRMSARAGHFMPTALLDSQFAALEMLGPEELGQVVSIDQDIDGIVRDTLAALRSPK